MLKCDENIICEWHIQSVWNIIIYHLSTRWSMICFMIRLSSRWIVKPVWCSFQQLLDGRETYVRHISLNKWPTSGVRKTAYSLPHCLNIVLQLDKRSNKTALFPWIELLFCIAWGHTFGGQAGISKSIVWTCICILIQNLLECVIKCAFENHWVVI